MASSSSAVTDTSKPTFDPSLYTSIANRLDYQYEISHVPEVSKIPIIDFPIVNAYIVFNKPQTSFKKNIKKKNNNNWSFSSFYYKGICPSFQVWPIQYPSKWKWKFHHLCPSQRVCNPMAKTMYTHLHFDAVRLALTFHERKGLPVASRISFPDSKFLEYQNVVIGTV